MIIEKVYGSKPLVVPQLDCDLPNNLSNLNYTIQHKKSLKLKLYNFFILSILIVIFLNFFCDYLIKKV